MNESEYKHIKAPDGLSGDQKKFLHTLDGAFDKVMGNFDLHQKQLNDLYTRTESKGKPFVNSEYTDEKRSLTRQWLVKHLKNQPTGDIEQKLFTPTHTTIDEDNTGAVLVPELLISEINHYVAEGGIARREMRYMPINSPGNSRKIPVETGSVAVQWVDELGSKPITGITVENVLQKLEKMAAIAVVSENLLEDQSFDLVSYVARRIGEAMFTEEDRVFFAGSTLASDRFDGIINASGVTTVAMDATKGVDDISADTLLKMIYSVPKHVRAGAKFYLNSDILFRLQRLRIDVLSEGDGLGGYLIQPATASAPASLWGYPIVVVDQLPGADDVAADEPFMVFSNLQKTCVYGDKQGIRLKVLTEATLTDANGDTISLAQNDAVGVRVYKRVGYVPVLPEGIAVLKTGTAT